jgi:uncharacterized protein (DUF58 family)
MPHPAWQLIAKSNATRESFMLTTRGFWFFVPTLAVLAVAIHLGAIQLTIVCLTLLFWFLAQWFLFQLRVRFTVRQLKLQRTLHTQRGEVETIWARQMVEVVVTLANEGALGLPYVLMTERLPALAMVTDVDLRADGALGAEQPMTLRYQLECKAPGRLRFEGVKVEYTDLQGFFTFATFVRDLREVRVLPALVVESSQAPYVKQHNVLPLLGTHRLARPGGSSELLDLRDYLPGDPPKTIAWNVSARRDRLVTKVFESEVPIRCTLFLDASNSVCVGPVGETALCRMVEIAAGVTQANASERDLTGLCIFDDNGVLDRIRPGRGSKHVLKILDLLTGVSTNMAHLPGAHVRTLLPYAYGLAQDVYPECLDRDINHFPAWLPLWAPQPAWAIPRGVPRYWWRFSRAYHREYRWRKELAAILSVRYDLGPGGLALLLDDDLACGNYLQRFLAEHQVAVPLPLYDENGRYVFAAPKKAQVLADALLSAVKRGKDNELFVLCVDLLECADQLGILERAVCVAKARHHQVIVVCPWANAVDPPSRRPSTLKAPTVFTGLELQRLLQQVFTKQLHEAFGAMQRAFGRLGVPMICAAQGDSVEWILHRMRRMRSHERNVR